MKKRSLVFLAKGVGHSTAVFFRTANHGRSMSNSG
ncbi:BH0584 [Halalkalibacterium halodurans C-125]|uniref:BH0584 protein n=1 Tax=Halalkalibacterium halodurans (strain ATCC BAA-125 / DSM 18197 / FERM 7344 / JCM 9153 / C-125) TaxID=272558 RepID=Q9KFA1_HALH5|nr:BH0584 [Halalkalibacterium halodurans C-125]